MPGLYLVTGGSRGLGAALVRQVTENGDEAISISRTPPQSGKHLECDLSDTETSASAVTRMFQNMNIEKFDEYILINNAGTIQPVGTTYGTSEVISSLSVNLISHIAITKAFIDSLEDISARKFVVNISSGAATKPYHGWSLYCSAKAGLEHFGHTIALEQQTAKAPVEVININPGIMDTKMQEEIRSATYDSFPDIDRFKAFYTENALSSADEVAIEIISDIKSYKQP